MPKEGQCREKWIESIKSHQSFTLNDERTPHFFVCSNHFLPEQIYSGKNPRLKPDSVPSVFPNVAVSMPHPTNPPSAPASINREADSTNKYVIPCYSMYLPVFSILCGYVSMFSVLSKLLSISIDFGQFMKLNRI